VEGNKGLLALATRPDLLTLGDRTQRPFGVTKEELTQKQGGRSTPNLLPSTHAPRPFLMFTFDLNLSSLRDQIRLRLADTISSGAVFQDETIDAMLAIYSYDEACAQLAESAGAEFARMASTVDNGPLRYEYQERAGFFTGLAKSIRSLAQPAPGAPPFTGATFAPMSSPNLCKYRTD